MKLEIRALHRIPYRARAVEADARRGRPSGEAEYYLAPAPGYSDTPLEWVFTAGAAAAVAASNPEVWAYQWRPEGPDRRLVEQ